MDEKTAIDRAIDGLELALIDALEEEEYVGLLLGRIGARIMGMMEEGDDLDEDECWAYVRVFVEDYRDMRDPSFKRHFRLSKPTYEELLRVLSQHLVDTNRVVRVRNSLDIPLLMVLWILATPDSFRSVALRFGVKPGTVHFHYCYIIEALRELAPVYIRWPDEAERQEIKGRFEAYSNIPGVVGVIDGTHNVVTAPLDQKEKYRNRHHTFSYNTMVLCDHNLLIRDFHIGEAGSLHDARVFRRSPLYRKLILDEHNEMLLPDEHILDDSAYAVMDCVMVPFKNRGRLTEQQHRFNRAVCKSRARIQHTFGKVFNQWRRMKMLHVVNTDLAVDHFTACYVLHNFMILQGQPLTDIDDPDVMFEHREGEHADDDEDDLSDDENDENGEGEEGPNVVFKRKVRAAKRRGIAKRNAIVNAL